MDMTIYREMMNKIQMSESCEASIRKMVDKIESEQNNIVNASCEQKNADCRRDEC